MGKDNTTVAIHTTEVGGLLEDCILLCLNAVQL